MQNYILYQAYGSIDHINECRYALLKYLQVYNLKPPASTTVVIYTDQPSFFDAFTSFFAQFEMQAVSTEQLQQWRGSINFVHRVKIEIMRDFFTLYNGALLYFDTDTYILQPVEPIFNEVAQGTFYLHAFEGVLDKKRNPYFAKWDDFLRKQTIRYGTHQLEYSGDLNIWNAGVIGLNHGNRHLLNDVLALTDAIYPKFAKHITEQFAFSYCLQKNGSVKSAEKQVHHYWNLKEFRKLLNAFFTKNEEESIPNLVKLVHHLDAAAIQQQKDVYKKMPLHTKWLRLLQGNNWSINQYIKKI